MIISFEKTKEKESSVCLTESLDSFVKKYHVCRPIAQVIALIIQLILARYTIYVIMGRL